MKILLFLLLGLISPKTENVFNRFKAPEGYRRVKTESGTFADYLQNLPLKPAGTHTLTYQGKIAATDAYTAAVVDISIGKRDLQQCADAVMRLRGEYLYHTQNYSAISFNFVSGFKCQFELYARGYRYQNNRWTLTGKQDNGYQSFLNYMDLVFTYAGTLSLEKELKKVNSATDLKIGDIFIHGGSPGHCFIIVDMAENADHKKIFMLAQSYMPAQNIQILQGSGSPWFSLDKPAGIPYGELIDMKYLRRF
ncbi:MAG: DUF4846 domain-containing protein [Mucilaginibacter sp.]|uniref:DUF4846 domain-containing protein n=1 Tax=Mucilaginibacter sp. TaxID=1882438 RepID=UPI00326503FC